MLSKEVCSTVTFSRDALCNSTHELLQSKDFYFLIELYCNKVSGEDQNVRTLLSYYFNDEGYVDCWRIPHVMLDIHQKNYQYHRETLDSPGFLAFFFSFVLGFYNYCMLEYKPFKLDEWAFKKEADAIVNLAICKHQSNLMIDSFSQIIENLQSYRGSEGANR